MATKTHLFTPGWPWPSKTLCGRHIKNVLGPANYDAAATSDVCLTCLKLRQKGRACVTQPVRQPKCPACWDLGYIKLHHSHPAIRYDKVQCACQKDQ